MPISAKNIEKSFGVPAHLARVLSGAIRNAESIPAYSIARGRAVENVLRAADKQLGGHGVENIRGTWQSNFWQDTVALYVNMGDSYVNTIIYKVPEGKFVATSWGDLIEGPWSRRHRVI